jgi:hypothetical protein
MDREEATAKTGITLFRRFAGSWVSETDDGRAHPATKRERRLWHALVDDAEDGILDDDERE